MPRHDADLYDYLATSKVSEVTVEQLEQSLENSFINKSNIEFWKGPITVHRLLEVSRTYPWGLPIPTAGVVGSVTTELGNVIIQPTGSELWQIVGMQGFGVSGSAVVDISWSDGSDEVLMISQKTLTASGTMIDLNEKVSAPFILSNSMYLYAVANPGVEAQIKFAYHKVSL